MKIDSTKILLFALVLMMAYNNFFKKEPTVEPVPVTLTLPESFGSTGLQALEPKVVIVQVPIERGSNQNIDIDKIWKEQYDKASQQIKDSLYNEAIRIRTYNDTLVNNEEIVIKGNATTRGSILDFKVDYKIKEGAITYIPKVETRLPRLTMGLGAGVSAPTTPNTNFSLRAELSLMNQKGHEINFGYSTEQRVSVGYTYNFKIIK